MVKFTCTNAALFCCQAALAFAQGDSDGSRPVAAIDTGLLIGTTTTDPSLNYNVNNFLGIPFAKPPVRWQLAEKPESWQGVRDASQFGNACHQRLNSPGTNDALLEKFFNNPPASVPDSEDCLYLNVYVPKPPPLPRLQSSTTGKPVMFWIHGGSDAGGTAALPIYNATGLAGNQDVIVVTTNYRLNVFGFPGSPDLPKSVQNFG
ncbi:hypothetical protein NQ176_g10201 [Zarea fungicola]|uniref:Uncharacterized protein n=1 Tax=Zarea fungicola TaxID=93591 RepID=A0ACC1MJB9_9HYPO|nr:hypothetical protein NQ176_g10201 [Lecanicillium fungicola]